MKVDLKNDPKEEKEVEELPEGDVEAGNDDQPTQEEVQAQQKADEDARVRAIEIENAELRGQNKALESFRSSMPSNDSAKEQPNGKANTLRDSNTLSDDDFKQKYGFEKFQATAAILEHDMKVSDSQNKKEIAELKAENRLTAKYGKSFAEHRREVDEIVEMAAPEIRQDPVKLEKLMERAYLAANAGKKPEAAAQTKGNDMQRRIVKTFDKPTPSAGTQRKEEQDSDALKPEYQKLGRAFGMTSEKERKRLMESPYIEMDLGNGTMFRDPARGVEKIEK